LANHLRNTGEASAVRRSGDSFCTYRDVCENDGFAKIASEVDAKTQECSLPWPWEAKIQYT